MNILYTLPPFEMFPKIHRLNREIIITEKIDGMNAQIYIDEQGKTLAGSRNRWRGVIDPKEDPSGFARWVVTHAESLFRELGPGRHYGEWWGQKIYRTYDQDTKIFSLFNTTRWTGVPMTACRVVPVLYQGMYSQNAINQTLYELKEYGSRAVPGFMRPEGIVIFHTASKGLFKVTIEEDEKPKGQV